MPDGYVTATRRPVPLAEPFATAECAWFWTMAALTARRDGARNLAGMASTLRPCEPDDVVRVLNRLYYQRRIDLMHARILRCLLYTSPSPRDLSTSRMPSSA